MASSAESHQSPADAAKPKRGARACLRCRAGKRQCDGEEPCSRCARASAACKYDKALVKAEEGDDDDEGMPARMSTMEAQLAGIERRQELILMALSELSNKLSHSSAAAPFVLPNVMDTQDTSPMFSGYSAPSASTSSLHPSSNLLHPAANIDLLATAASSTADAFALSVHAPMRAMDDTELLSPHQREELDAALEGEAEQDVDDERPAKRAKLTIISEREPSWRTPDIVEKGRCTEREARSLIFYWHKELSPFCAILDKKFDTFQSLRQRSPFLLSTVIYTALRAKTGDSKPSKTLAAAAEETRAFAMNLILERSPSVETIQALVLLSAWHEDPYVFSGIAQRLALSSRLDRIDQELTSVGWTGTAEETRSLTAKLRVWCYITFLDSRHSRSSGRPVMQHESELNRMLACASGLLESPLLNADDVRIVCNLRLVVIERQIELAAMDDFAGDDDFSHRMAYVTEMRGTLKAWYETHDAHLARFAPHPQEWCRRSHYRHFLDANLFLACTVLKVALLDTSAPPIVREISRSALDHALAVIREVLRSHVYTSTIRCSGFLTRVDLSFAALMSLKLAHLCPDAVVASDVAKDVQGITDLLSPIPSARRYVLILKNARQQYLDMQNAGHAVTQHKHIQPCWLEWIQESTSISQPILPGEIDWGRLMSDFQDGEESQDAKLESLNQLNSWPDFSFGFEEYHGHSLPHTL